MVTMRKILLIILLSAVAVAGNAQLLWKVTGGNTCKPSYLFGTIHLESAQYIDSVPGLRDAIANVDVIYGEVLKDSLTSESTVMKMAKDLIAPADSTIDKLLTKEEYELVDSVVKSYMMGLIGLDRLSKLKPLAVTTQLTMLQMQKHFPKQQGYKDGLDVGIQSEGQKLGKHIDGLETVEMQIKMLFGTPLELQALELVNFCRKDKDIVDYSDKLCAAYHAHDLAAIEKIFVDDEDEELQENMERLAYKRNRQWMDKITMTLPVQSVLVAVGAAHLVGEQGLIKLLRDRGYTVEPVF